MSRGARVEPELGAALTVHSFPGTERATNYTAVLWKIWRGPDWRGAPQRSPQPEEFYLVVIRSLPFVGRCFLLTDHF
jgi:hypothetical protein